MKVQIGSRIFGISFEHRPTKRKRGLSFTFCTIIEYEPDAPPTESWIMAEGKSVCCPPDTFSKEGGRKRSLTRALEDGGFTKEERTAFWNAYHSRPGGMMDTT